MEINENTVIGQLLEAVPECMEFLYPFKASITRNATIGSLAANVDEPLNVFMTGLDRQVKRKMQNSCVYSEMRKRLIKPGALNVAGFVSFVWQNAFVEELKSKADEMGVVLNLNIFPKHEKKQFQNYLALCQSPDDLPELLIGKGFSSLTTQLFIDRFVKPGYFCHSLYGEKMGKVFLDAGLSDQHNHYHPFGVDELVMLYDKTVIDSSISVPASWNDLLKPEYRGKISQMGKAQRDHFGFIMMLYLFAAHGEKGIIQYAQNVKVKQHFSHIIKNIGLNGAERTPVNIVHQYASLFIRSDARELTQVIQTVDGNPAVTSFFLLKKGADEKASQMATHLFSPSIKSILERGGTTHITSDHLISNNDKIRWIGWNKIKEMRLPYLKEYLSDVAYENCTLNL